MFNRRRFLAGAIPGLALITGGISVAGYRQGGCPLSSSGYCVGPCSALVDRDGDLFCDRINAPAPVAPAPAAQQESVETDAVQQAPIVEPQGADESPALSPQSEQAQPKQTQPKQAQPKPTAQPRADLVVLCPFGLVNDRFPGRCNRYVDRNGNRICDLSEPRPAGQANP